MIALAIYVIGSGILEAREAKERGEALRALAFREECQEMMDRLDEVYAEEQKRLIAQKGELCLQNLKDGSIPEDFQAGEGFFVIRRP